MAAEGGYKVTSITSLLAASLYTGTRRARPIHGDATLNVHDTYFVRRGDEIIDQWPSLAARKFQ